MAIERIVAALVIFALGAGSALAQWRSEVAQLFRKGDQVPAIAALLEEAYPRLESTQDKADASALLAYCAFKGANSPAETRWIIEYFENNRMGDTGFAFIDLANQANVIGWLNGWRSRFPYVADVSLIKGVGDKPIVPQGLLPLVIETTSDAIYKFSLNNTVLEGGEFKAGFNVIALDANELFLQPGTRVYTLEVRSGGLTLKREITLDTQVSVPPRPPQTPPANPASGTLPMGGPPITYSLSLYIGGELVMESRKIESPPSVALGIKPNNNPYGYRPDWVLRRDQPNPMNSFSIIQALGMLYSLLKDLFKKRGKKDVEPPKIETVHDLTLTYDQKDVYGRTQELRVTLRLRSKSLPISPQGP
jgi:hypothetical protein